MTPSLPPRDVQLLEHAKSDRLAAMRLFRTAETEKFGRNDGRRTITFDPRSGSEDRDATLDLIRALWHYYCENEGIDWR